MSAVTLEFRVNGRRQRVRVPAMKRLLDVLREDCALPGTKEGCGEGECGACTVSLNGAVVNSCLVPAVQADGARILTVEGLARGKTLDALQQAFVAMGGAQCGICTPGMLIAAQALLANTRGVPGEHAVREALAGNLCRCTGYQKIVDAVRAAARAPRTTSRDAATRPARNGATSARSRASRNGGKPARSRASRSGTTPARRTARATSGRRVTAR